MVGLDRKCPQSFHEMGAALSQIGTTGGEAAAIAGGPLGRARCSWLKPALTRNLWVIVRLRTSQLGAAEVESTCLGFDARVRSS